MQAWFKTIYVGGSREKWNNMASQKYILISLLIFFTAFIIIGISILVALLILANSDPNQTGSEVLFINKNTPDYKAETVQTGSLKV